MTTPQSDQAQARARVAGFIYDYLEYDYRDTPEQLRHAADIMELQGRYPDVSDTKLLYRCATFAISEMRQDLQDILKTHHSADYTAEANHLRDGIALLKAWIDTNAPAVGIFDEDLLSETWDYAVQEVHYILTSPEGYDVPALVKAMSTAVTIHHVLDQLRSKSGGD